MPNIVRVIKAGVPPYDNVFEVHWMEDNGDTRWVHMFAKDELNAWQKAEKQLKEKENGRSLTND